MPRWELMPGPGRPHRSDDERRHRLYVLAKVLLQAEADTTERRRAFDDEIAAAQRDGQGALAEEALKALAECRRRSLDG